MGTLFVLEFKDFIKTTQVTDLVMDPGGVDGNDMYIAFKVSMPDLVCFPAAPLATHPSTPFFSQYSRTAAGTGRCPARPATELKGLSAP